jgi:hypothetical protein
MELVPGLSRHLRAYSTWIAIAAGVFDILYLSLEALKDQIEPSTFAFINVGLVTAIKIATLVKQNIPVTEEVKKEIVASAKATPIKETE